MKNSKGFTLIELIVVIAILGILAAVALPRFIALQQEAKIAKMQGLFGSVRSASMLARSRCELDLAAGTRAGANACDKALATGSNYIEMDGIKVDMAFKYAAANALGIIAAAQIDTITDGLTFTPTVTPTTITLNNAATPASCVINYTAATATAAPVISLVTSGC